MTAMRNGSLTLAGALLSLVVGFGCSPSKEPLTGYILGYDIRGVALVSLKRSEVRYLCRQDASHFRTLPAWDPQNSRIFCVDKKQKAIIWFKIGDSVEQAVFPIPAGLEVPQVTLMPNGTHIVFYLRPSGGPTKLVLLNLKSNVTRVLCQEKLDPGQRIEPVGDNAVLVLRMVRDGDKVIRHIAQVQLDDGGLRDVLTLPEDGGFFYLGPDGRTVLVVTDRRLFLVGDISLGTLRPVVHDLPGRDRGLYKCFNSNDTVLVWRERHEMRFLGTYELNIRTGKSRKATRYALHDMRYIAPDIAPKWP